MCRLGQIRPYLLEAVGVLGGGHSPEPEQLTWDMKVAEGSTEGHILEYATGIRAGRLTVGEGYN